jgi:hypothetical protein
VPLSSELVAARAWVSKLLNKKPMSRINNDDLGRTIILFVMSTTNPFGRLQVAVQHHRFSVARSTRLRPTMAMI